ncbi:MAG: LmeA family phospholipid-binding protein [Candidatus Zixiibacteriota bacterium]|jgi:4-amino-4-deoxy-L-arabinose transferase-like glycosyltransferase
MTEYAADIKRPIRARIRWGLVLVAAALAFHFVANLVWFSQYDVPPSWDFAVHLTKSLEYADALFSGRWAELADVDNYYPPLGRLPAVLAYPLFGRTEAVGVSANFAWFVILVAATYGLGRRLGDRRAGAAAALFAAFTPFLYNYTRFYALVVPGTAAAAAALWALLSTDGFRRPGRSFLFGVTLGLAVLVKWSVAAFVLPPLLWALLSPGRGPGEAVSRSRRFLNAGLAALPAFLVASPWYLRHLFHFVRAARHTAVEAVAQGDPAVFTAASFTHYLSAGVYQFGIAMLVVGAAALVYCAVRRRPGTAYLLFWVLGSYLILTLLRNKDYRFTAPMLPAFAVAFGVAFADLPKKWLRISAASAAGAYALSIFFVGSFGIGDLPGHLVWKPLRTRLIVYDSEIPRREDWGLVPILNEVAAGAKGRDGPINLCVIPNCATFAEVTFRYYATRDGLPVRVFRPRDDFPNFCDFVVSKDGDQGDDPGWATFDKIRKDPEWFTGAYVAAGSYPLADGSTATLYRREVTPLPEFSPDGDKMKSVLAAAYPKLLRGLWGTTISTEGADAARGYYDGIHFRARRARVLGAPVTALDVRFHGVVVNPWAPPGEAQLLRLDSLSLGFRVAGPAVAKRLERECPGLSGTTVAVEGEALGVGGTYKGLPVTARVTFRDDGRSVRVVASRLTVARIPVPSGLVRYLNSQIEPLVDRRHLPFGLGPVHLSGGPAGIDVRVHDLHQ